MSKSGNSEGTRRQSEIGGPVWVGFLADEWCEEPGTGTPWGPLPGRAWA